MQFHELADLVLEEFARLRADVELLVARLQLADDRAVLDDEVDRQDELDSLLAAFVDHLLRLIDADLRHDRSADRFCAGSSAMPRQTFFAVEQGGRFAERAGECAGGEHARDLCRG